MNDKTIIQHLSQNIAIFKGLLSGLTEEEYLWKPQPEKWCLLEVINHLHDEEREDFRTRTKQVLEAPLEPLPPIDPVGWVQERAYIEQDFNEILNKFMKERDQSIEWLQSLESPKWDNAYDHPKLGKMTAKLFLTNWLAHDYLHIRQITRLKYQYLKHLSEEPINYAGNW